MSLVRFRNIPAVADKVRYLSCKALLGLSIDSTVAQILSKLHVTRMLSELVRSDPVLPENTKHYTHFKNCAMELIARLSGLDAAKSSAVTEASDSIMRKIEKANIVANTTITYDPVELLLVNWGRFKRS